MIIIKKHLGCYQENYVVIKKIKCKIFLLLMTVLKKMKILKVFLNFFFRKENEI